MYRHSPLMRSLLSQSQTPTAPRRAVGFFRSDCLTGCPAVLITQSTSDWLILFCQPFQPSTEATLTEHAKMSTQTFGAASARNPVHNDECNLLLGRRLLIDVIQSSTFCTETCTTVPIG